MNDIMLDDLMLPSPGMSVAKEHESEIDAHTCEIAAQLGLPPKSLIGQFLEYRINIPIKI